MLPQNERLTRKRDFAYVYQRKKSLATPLLVLYVRRYDVQGLHAETRRIGFVVSKKAAKRAHDRNRVKRRLREICRLHGAEWRRGWDGVLVVRTNAVHASYADLDKTVCSLVRRAGFLVPEVAATDAPDGVSNSQSAA